MHIYFQSDNGGKQSQYFNIYSDWEPSNECDLDSIARMYIFTYIQYNSSLMLVIFNILPIYNVVGPKLFSILVKFKKKKKSQIYHYQFEIFPVTYFHQEVVK